MSKLLIEIFTEELPAWPLIKNIESIKQIWMNLLKENEILSDFEFLYTPNRLILLHNDFKIKQEDKEIVVYGPPANIAFKDGKPTNALFSFIKKNNIDIGKIKSTQKDGKEIICAHIAFKGKDCIEILGEIVDAWLKKMNFGKAMRWGNYKEEFIRPVRNICILLDDMVAPARIFGLDSNNMTIIRGDRIKVKNLDNYLEIMESKKILINPQDREKKICEEIQKIEIDNNLNVEIDKDLLKEIVAITEYPTALLGNFDKSFLNIPEIIIITSMKENQRYFANYKNGAIDNSFIVVSNALTKDFSLIISGNEKVLRARLTDAEFFYKNDLQNISSGKLDFGDLSKIGFLEGAGNLLQKIQREKNIASILCEKLNLDSKKAIKAIELAKNDLKSQVVGEFSELQGIMGGIYAKIANLDAQISTSIKEQYLPNGADTSLPSNVISAIVNISIKFDNICTLFALNKIPSGSKDPFALRRSAISILKICDKFDLNLDIEDILENIKLHNNQDFNTQILLDFMKDRYFAILNDINPSIIRASFNFPVKTSFEKIRALNTYFLKNDIRAFIATFKRVANVLEDINLENIDIDITLFNDIEKDVYKSLQNYKNIKHDGYLEQLENLHLLKEKLDLLFEKTLILAPERDLRQNRIALIRLIEDEFLIFGNLREISI